jgi:acetyl-CoA C-acetyltransferase
VCFWNEIRNVRSSRNHVGSSRNYFDRSRKFKSKNKGFESMSNSPYVLPKARFGYRLGNGVIEDSMVKDGLTDPFSDKHMGWCAEQCAKEYKFSREEQDKYAIESYKRSENATKNGKFKNEIFSVSIETKKGTTYVTEDEEFTNVNFDKMSSLKPVFDKEGTVTAGKK